jgi:hypothetical protein
LQIVKWVKKTELPGWSQLKWWRSALECSSVGLLLLLCFCCCFKCPDSLG